MFGAAAIRAGTPVLNRLLRGKSKMPTYSLFRAGKYLTLAGHLAVNLVDSRGGSHDVVVDSCRGYGVMLSLNVFATRREYQKLLEIVKWCFNAAFLPNFDQR